MMLLMKFDYDGPAGLKIIMFDSGDRRTHERTQARVPSYKLTLSLWLWWVKQEGQVALKRSPEFSLKLTYRYL